MSLFKISADTAALRDLARSLERAGHDLPAVEAGIVNRVAPRVRAAVVPALTAQTGLNKRTIAKAVKLTPATGGRPVAYLYARGGNIGLRSFGAHEEGSGVAATVKGHRIAVAGGFTRSGKAPGRHFVQKLGGQVFVNAEGKKWRGHMTKVKSGVYISSEMTSGESLAAFERVAEAELPAEAAKALAGLLSKK